MSQHQLKLIKVKGYKSIKDQDIPLTEMNVLIGQNGAGKTNFISIFKLLRNIIEERLQYTVQKSGGAENLLYYGSKETPRIILGMDFSPNMYQINLEVSKNDSLFIQKEICYYDHGRTAKTYNETINNSGALESALQEYIKTHRYGVGVHVYNVMREWRVYHFHDTSENAGVKKYCSISDSRFLFEDASNLAAFLYILKETQNEYYDRIVKTIQLVIPFFKDFILLPNPLNENNIRLEWMDKFSDKTFSANELSDGSLRFICMATLLLQKNLPKVILLDEPELGLHPSAITILAGLLKKSSKRSQVIVSTQSVSLVNEFDAEDIIVTEKNGAETIFNRLEADKLESRLNDYSLGELWDKNVIGGKP